MFNTTRFTTNIKLLPLVLHFSLEFMVNQPNLYEMIPHFWAEKLFWQMVTIEWIITDFQSSVRILFRNSFFFSFFFKCYKNVLEHQITFNKSSDLTFHFTCIENCMEQSMLFWGNLLKGYLHFWCGNFENKSNLTRGQQEGWELESDFFSFVLQSDFALLLFFF